MDNGRSGDVTFAAADDEILASSAKSASDDKMTLLLPFETPDNIRRVNVDELDLSLRQVHQHVPRIPTHGNRGGIALKREAILLFMRLEIVHVDFRPGVSRNESSPIRSQCTILHSESTAPRMDHLAAKIPMTEVRLQVERRRHERLSVSGPGGRRNRFVVMVDSQDASAGLESQLVTGCIDGAIPRHSTPGLSYPESK